MKLNINKIVDGLTKSLVSEKSDFPSNPLFDEIKNQAKQKLINKEECENLSNLLKDNIDHFTKILPNSKLGSIKIKNIIPSKINSEIITDLEYKKKILEKEDGVYASKVLLDKIDKQKKVKTNKQQAFFAGKRLLICDETNFNSSLSRYLKDDCVSTNETYVLDSFRGRNGHFWSIDNQSKQFVFVSTIEEAQGKRTSDLNFGSVKNDNVPSDFGRTVQTLDISSKKDRFFNAEKKYSKDLWKSFVIGGPYLGSTLNKKTLDFVYTPTIKNDDVYFDHCFEMTLPFYTQGSEKRLSDSANSIAHIKQDYNFYIEEYETNITKKNVLENNLPNIHVMISEIENEISNPDFKNHISLAGNIPVDSKKILSVNKKHLQTKKTRTYDIKNNPIGEYFDLFARTYEKVKPEDIKKLSFKFQNIAFPVESVEKYREYEDKSELFPMNVQVSFSLDKTAEMTQILKDCSLTNEFVSQVINKIEKKQNEILSTEEAQETIIDSILDEPQRNIKFEKANRRIYDLADIIVGLESGEEKLVDNAVFLGDYRNTQNIEFASKYKLYRKLNSQIFQSKIQSLIRQRMRTYEDIIDGKTAYNETVVYRIAKFVGTDTNVKPIQNIYVPNSTTLDIFKYIDTQVKYDKQYSYVVYAYQFVIGNKYWYSSSDVDSFEHHAFLKVVQEPSLKLVEVPYCKFTTRVMDRPPAPPEVDIAAYRGIDNEVLLRFNNSVSDFKQKPTIIKQSDMEIFQKVRQSQQNNQLIHFGGDDRTAFYEIYRLDSKPFGYQDFENALIKSLDTDISKKSIQKATNAAFVDSIQPNRKYYYVFRCIDVHGHISNPTSLYQLEMINENGTIFPLISVVDFKEKNEKQVSKNFKRFVQIIPNVMQSLIDEEKSGFASAASAEQVKNNVVLGLAKEKVWGKNYRMKVKSRNTGKVIEFDFTFEHNRVNKVKAE